MPEIILGLAALLAGIYFLIRRLHGSVRTVKQFGEETQELQHTAGSLGFMLFGSHLARVSDPRLAATILMLQLVRSGSHVTAAEKTQIMELMDTPLGISNVETIFTRAWGYTDARRAFSPVADELVPMLRRRLGSDEAEQLVEMLLSVANAYGEASELQLAGIARLRRRLGASEPQRAW